jgi:serine phosphatase RsbU (regulator of sigma subunit)
MSDAAREAVTSVIQAMKTSQMYPQDHPRVQDKIDDTIALLDQIFDDQGELVVGVDGNQLLIQEAPADQSDEFLTEFRERISERNVGSLVLKDGLSTDELLDLIWILRNSADEVMQENELRDDLTSSFDHVEFNSVSVQISEDRLQRATDEDESSDETGSDDDEDASDEQVASPYEVLVDQLDDVLEDVETDEFLSEMPDELKQELRSSFEKIGFNVLTSIINQLVSQAEELGEDLSDDSAQKLLNNFLVNMTRESDVTFSEFKEGLEETLGGIEEHTRDMLIRQDQDQETSGGGSTELISGLDTEVRGNVIGNELREGDTEQVREAVDEMTSSGDELISLSDSVTKEMDVSAGADATDLSTYFQTLTGDVSGPETKASILFLDPDSAYREQYAEILIRMGCSVDEFERGDDVRKAISDEETLAGYDLLLMDVELPEKNGLDLLKELGAKRLDLPAVIMTEETDFKDSFEVLTYPDLEFLEKPVEPDKFVTTILEHIQATSDRAFQESKADEEERQEAREIQEKLINQEFPSFRDLDVFSYYDPSTYVGGDFLDYMPLDANRNLFLIGDVAGRGVPAAMVMVMVRSILRMCFQQMTSPEKALKRANQLITRDMKEGMYVSLAVCVLDTENNELTVFNAGQRTPIMWRSEEEQSELLISDGIAIGLSEQESFESSLTPKSISLHPHDTLVFYTEGVTEAANEDGETFGVSNLLTVTSEHGGGSAEILTKEIVRAVKQFQGDASQEKDATILTIQSTPA